MKSDVPKIYGLIHFSTITRSECCVYGMPIIFPTGEIFRLRKGECFVFLTEYTHLNIYEPTNLAPVVNQVTTTYRALLEITISSHTFSVVKCMHFVLSVRIQFMISKVIIKCSLNLGISFICIYNFLSLSDRISFI